MIRSRDPTFSGANQFTCRGSGLQVCVQGQSRFKVRTPLAVTRSIHRAFLSPSHFTQGSQPSTATPAFSSECRREARSDKNDTIKAIGTRVSGYSATWVNQTSAPHGSRPGAAGRERLKACVSPGRLGDGPRRGGTGVRELDT